MSGDWGFKSFFVGTNLLFKTLDDYNTDELYNPVLLRRNLRHRFEDLAEELCLSQSKHSQHVHRQHLHDSAQRIMRSRELRAWQPSSDEIESFQKEDILSILPRSILRHGVTASESKASKSSADSRIEWLPQPDTRRIKCEIECAIQRRYETKQDDKRKKGYTTLARESRSAILLWSPIGAHSQFDVTLQSGAFEIPKEHVFSTPSLDPDSVGMQMPSAPMKDLRVQISLIFRDSRDRHDVYQALDGRQVVRVPGEDFSSPRLFTVCYPLAQGLEVVSSVEKIKSELHPRERSVPFEMTTDQVWIEKAPSILAASQQIKAEMRGQRYPADITAPSKDTDTTTCEITYIWTGSVGKARSLTANNLACQFCKSKLPRSSLEQLQAHYKTHHDHFEFFVEEKRVVPGSRCRRIKMYMELSNPGKSSNKGVNHAEERSFSWIRPDRPFDMSKYLRGDDSWITEGYGFSKSERRPVAESLHVKALPSQLWHPKAPEEVEAIVPRKRKRYPVPDVPGTDLYRTATKRRLRPGEMLCESEDDSEDDWASLKKRIRHHELPGKSRGEFYDLFDTFVRREALSSDIHLQDAVIRFCRQYRDRLIRPLVFRDFKTKLEQMRLTGLISRLVEDYCIGVVTISDKDAKENDLLEPSRSNKPVSGGVRGLLEKWNDVPEPANVQNAHPLTLHPKIWQTFGYAAFHPTLQKDLDRLVARPRLLAETHARLNEILAGKHAGWAVVRGYPTWVQQLAQGEPRHMMIGKCICGKPAGDVMGSIHCSNRLCRSSAFHRRCVNVDAYDPTWKCAQCAARSTPWILTSHDETEKQKTLDGAGGPDVFDPRGFARRLLSKRDKITSDDESENIE